MDTVVDKMIHKWGVPIFWVVFVIVIIIAIIAFVALPNEWLYGRYWRQRKKDKEASDNFWENLH